MRSPFCFQTHPSLPSLHIPSHSSSKVRLEPPLSCHPSALTPHFLGDDQDVTNFNQRVAGSNTIEGLPKFDPKRVVHASQTIEVLKPLPLTSGSGWRLKKRLASIRENSASSISLSCRRSKRSPGVQNPVSSWRASSRSSTRKTRPTLVSLFVSFPVSSTLQHEALILYLASVRFLQSWRKAHRHALRAHGRRATTPRIGPDEPRTRLGRA